MSGVLGSWNDGPTKKALVGFVERTASGGRPISQEVFGIPRERVIGSSATLDYASDERGGTITHRAEADYLDDGPQKPIRIWSRTDTSGAEQALERADSSGWTIVNIKNDWATVF